MTTEELRKSLLAAPKNGFTRISADDRAEINAFAKRYMAFIDACKTEREATSWAVAEAEKLGFVPFVPGMAAQGYFLPASQPRSCRFDTRCRVARERQDSRFVLRIQCPLQAERQGRRQVFLLVLQSASLHRLESGTAIRKLLRTLRLVRVVFSLRVSDL